MSSQRLPEQIAPFKHARQGISLRGKMTLKEMPRLVELLADEEGVVEVDLHLDIDSQGISFLRGHLQTEINITCQRCTNPMRVRLETEVNLGFAPNEEKAEQLPEDYEPYIVTEDMTALASIVEDEFILALPIVSVHSDQACQPWLEKNKRELAIADEQAEEKENPFAVLAGLKRD